MGSAVIETMVDYSIFKPVKRLGMRDGYVVVNGNRDELHELYNIDTSHMINAALELMEFSG